MTFFRSAIIAVALFGLTVADTPEPTQSLAPSTSSAPSSSSAPSKAPSSFLKSEWSINVLTAPKSNFSQDKLGEIELVYMYFTEPAKEVAFGVWNYTDCSGRENGQVLEPDALEVLDPEYNFVTYNGENATQLTTIIDVHTDKLENATVFEYLDDNKSAAKIEFCLRVDLKSNNESMVFDESRIRVLLNLTKGFDNIEVTDVGYDAAETKKTDADLDFGVDAYQCAENNGSWEQMINPTALGQNSKINICIAPNSISEDTIVVSDVSSLLFKQGGGEPYVVVEDFGFKEGLTTVERVNNLQDLKVSTLIISRFYQNLNSGTPLPITADGTAVFSFKARRLGDRQRSNDMSGTVENESSPFSFNFIVASPPAVETNKTEISPQQDNTVAIIIIVSVALTAVVVATLFMFKKGRNNKSG